ncbi:putative peptidyl-tRNA hydrolase 2 isoform X2 [Tachypleus tridentatus]|uniref:putative peptidyl-tRNA hydrolase 2 isoform X2 n=1 Tax=Tachypleus tridentatus TaxID=6853 RepID=UPI003FD2BFE7
MSVCIVADYRETDEYNFCKIFNTSHHINYCMVLCIYFYFSCKTMAERREAGDGEENPSKSGVGGTRNWQPNEDYLKMLMGMGVSKNAAEKALFYTGNRSADLAAGWIFENQDADLETPLDAEADDLSDDDDDDVADVFKMVLVVNISLEMGTGKTAAQAAHAAIGLHRLLLQDENKYGDMLLQWEEFGETKIVLGAETTEDLIELERRALSLGLPTYLVQDAGKTQIPEGSTTVLSIMGRVDLVDQVTGSLRLL